MRASILYFKSRIVPKNINKIVATIAADLTALFLYANVNQTICKINLF